MKIYDFLRTTVLVVASHALIFSATSCDGKRPTNKPVIEVTDNQRISTNNEIENFDKFIEDFFTKKDFQYVRIIFPLQNIVYDIDSKEFDTTQIKKEDWTFWNVHKLKNVVIEVTKRDNNERILNAQIKETGVSVNYVFTLKEEKWYLIKIIDEST